MNDWKTGCRQKSQAQKLASKKHQSSKQRQPTMEDHVEPKKEQRKKRTFARLVGRATTSRRGPEAGTVKLRMRCVDGL